MTPPRLARAFDRRFVELCRELGIEPEAVDRQRITVAACRLAAARMRLHGVDDHGERCIRTMELVAGGVARDLAAAHEPRSRR